MKHLPTETPGKCLVVLHGATEAATRAECGAAGANALISQDHGRRCRPATGSCRLTKKADSGVFSFDTKAQSIPGLTSRDSIDHKRSVASLKGAEGRLGQWPEGLVGAKRCATNALARCRFVKKALQELNFEITVSPAQDIHFVPPQNIMISMSRPPLVPGWIALIGRSS
jgi:hypothetical protein